MENLFLLLILLFIAFVIIYYSYRVSKRQEQYNKDRIKNSYGSASFREYADGEYAHIGGYSNNHPSDFRIDDITWNDLNMDSIFMDMNYTQSSAGEEYLYYLLRNPAVLEESCEDFERKIRHFGSDAKKRFDLQYALYKCGRTGKYSIYDYLNNLDIIKDENFNSDVWLLLMYAVAVFVLFVNLGLGITAIAFLLIYGGITYFRKKRRIEPYVTSFSYVFRMINGAKKICAVDEPEISAEQERLRELVKELNSFVSFSYLIMSPNSGTGNIIEIILDYIRIFFHVDLIKFFQMRNQITIHWDCIDEILGIMGRLDSIVSVACYREYIGDWCNPEFSEDNYYAEDIYHPLLVNPVKNSVSFNKGVLLTGSNASGKSTMLKTVAVAAVLAQAVNTVPAKKYSAPRYRVYTSLALNDDILAGESYYMTEIKSLKRIMDSSRDDKSPILACVDEVLRGTNTNERISASYVILKKLSSVNGIIFAATHDLELANLLNDIYDNYHFEETINQNDISFEYRILPGIATTRNAIKLLEIVGYDKDIITEATRISEASKEWKFV